MTDSDANTDRVESDAEPENSLNQQPDPSGGDVLVKDADPAESDAENLPDPRCVAVADGTGERCRNRAIPGSDRCHAHVDYADLADPPADTHEERTREETPPGVWP